MKSITIKIILALALATTYWQVKGENWPTIPAIERYLHPEMGTCGRCDRPWEYVSPHSTQYNATMGCFPLCERCWEGLKTPEARLPYYATLFNHWIELNKVYNLPDSGETPERWEEIKRAVMEGK